MGKDYEKICEWGNLYDAYLKARRGKRWKNSVAKVEASALEAVALIQRELQTRTYRPGGYRAFYVYEPKRRLIQTNSFKDKIVQHAFCDQVLYDALTKPFILDNYGSQVGNIQHENISLGKAGRNRWLGRRPQVRGVAMNPIDHPLGGGEGRSSGGRHPVSPWGMPAKGFKTRDKNKASSRLIIKRRGQK